jgi:hypothetical protein
MSEKRVIPAFATEAEEAQWWYDNREAHSEEFVKAAAEGRTRRVSLAEKLERAQLRTVVDLKTQDMERARSLAERKGLDLNVFLTQIVHEALEREAQNAA